MSADREELHETFDHFDADKNGHIDEAEFARLLRALGAGVEPEELAIGFGIIDEDGNGTIEFEEFYRWWNDR